MLFQSGCKFKNNKPYTNVKWLENPVLLDNNQYSNVLIVILYLKKTLISYYMLKKSTVSSYNFQMTISKKL